MMEMRLTRELIPSRPRYRQWTLVLQEFGKLLEEYNSTDDVAYWYGERALSGLLAATAWRTRAGWSLEEFSGLRRTGGRQNSGRGDVWIGIGRRTFTVEAKILWPQGPLKTAIADTRKLLDEAGNQLDSLDAKYQADVPAAVCYLVPELNLKGGYCTPEDISSSLKCLEH